MHHYLISSLDSLHLNISNSSLARDFLSSNQSMHLLIITWFAHFNDFKGKGETLDLSRTFLNVSRKRKSADFKAHGERLINHLLMTTWFAHSNDVPSKGQMCWSILNGFEHFGKGIQLMKSEWQSKSNKFHSICKLILPGLTVFASLYSWCFLTLDFDGFDLWPLTSLSWGHWRTLWFHHQMHLIISNHFYLFHLEHSQHVLLLWNPNLKWEKTKSSQNSLSPRSVLLGSQLAELKPFYALVNHYLICTFQWLHRQGRIEFELECF